MNRLFNWWGHTSLASYQDWAQSLAFVTQTSVNSLIINAVCDILWYIIRAGNRNNLSD